MTENPMHKVTVTFPNGFTATYDAETDQWTVGWDPGVHRRPEPDEAPPEVEPDDLNERDGDDDPGITEDDIRNPARRYDRDY